MKSPKSLIREYNFHTKKRFGQNFLQEPKICSTIVNQAKISKEDIVLEIGPGFGALTIPTAKMVKKVIAVEKDHKLAEILREQLTISNITNVKVIEGDILNLNIDKLIEPLERKIIILGNIPYNISSQILVKIVENRETLHRAILTLQKEVAERIYSKPGSKKYGRLSVIMQYYAKIRKLLEVKPSFFFPKPKIESIIVEISPLDKLKLTSKNEQLLLSVVKASFGNRRKTIKNSLAKNLSSMNHQGIHETILNHAKIDPNRRAETLSVKEFVSLGNCFHKFKNNLQDQKLENNQKSRPTHKNWLRGKDSNLD